MPSNIKDLFKVTLYSLSLGVLSSTAVSASEDISKLSSEKQAELNRLIAEAVKKAGIELDEEELTIVIVKKPDQNNEATTESEGQVIGEISSEQLTEDTTPNNASDSSVATAQEPSTKTIQNQEKATPKAIVVSDPSANTKTTVTELNQPKQPANIAKQAPLIAEDQPTQKVAEQTKDDDKKTAVAIIPATTTTSVTTTSVTATSAAQTTEKVAAPIAASTPALIDGAPAVATKLTSETPPAIVTPATAVTESANAPAALVSQPKVSQPNPDALTNPPIPELTPYTEPLNTEQTKALVNSNTTNALSSDEALTTEELSGSAIAAPSNDLPEDTAVLQQRELEELQQTTAGSIKRAIEPNQQTILPKQSNEYYGNYIPPERQMDAYYSSDLMEAINTAGGSNGIDIAIPADQMANMTIPAMISTEMSDLVVQGALDATAAGGVSTTTLKTAIVVPDDTVFDDLEKKDPNDEELEEIKKALDKEDLNKRVKEALALINQSKNRGSSNTNTSMGSLSANDVRVTATVQSRRTLNATTTTIRQSNLSNTNFR